ncbi:MAG: type II toxin-antitoxin system VapC family toxin [Thermoproteales archaeon]|nr:type II toxin-antitoxin system VapC family toxin [Thermoproteales archaeon]
MKVFIDANLLIYLNTLKTPEKRVVYEDFYLKLLSKYKAYTDVLVLDETIYVSWRKYRVPYETSIGFIESIVLPFVEILSLGENEYKKATEVLKEHRVKPSDALHIATMILNGIQKVASEDNEYDDVNEITRIWIDRI